MQCSTRLRKDNIPGVDVSIHNKTFRTAKGHCLLSHQTQTVCFDVSSCVELNIPAMLQVDSLTRHRNMRKKQINFPIPVQVDIFSAIKDVVCL